MRPLGLFQGYGVELEYMIVHQDTLDVFPVTDQVLKKVSGSFVSEVELGSIAWSNELVLHVIELKTNGPALSLDGLAGRFQSHVQRINEILKDFGGILMPGAMHPWMDPYTETRLWPHEYNPIYEAYNRIFDCRGHGWSNLQSTHINLPFSDDKEFERLHAAIRLLMPVMPGLTASSPVMDSRVNGVHDNRLAVYRKNSVKIPSVSGDVIPEPVFNRNDYENILLQGIYNDIQPYDTDGILQHEWLNSRGAIARFDRMAIEIRILDIQECPAADLATTGLITRVLKALSEERWAQLDEQKDWPVDKLNRILMAVSDSSGDHVIDDEFYLSMFGCNDGPVTASVLWAHLSKLLPPPDPADVPVLETIIKNGTLSKRLIQSLGNDRSEKNIRKVYRRLCTCLAEGEMFTP
jgi:glutamate---cysteine ligase / carboxylate-amine ligase